nr:hypothetical protein Iba_chr10dCG14190 [Ipomoea batatas]
MRNILRGSFCGGDSGRGGEDPLANQEDPPPGNTSLEIPGGSSDQQGEPLGNPSTEVRGGGDPLASPTFLLVFPFRPSLGQPASRHTFVVFPVFRQVEPSSIRLPVRLQVWFPSDSHGHAPLSPHRVAIDIAASADVHEDASQVDVEEARLVEEAADTPALGGGEDPLANQEDPPPGNTSLEFPGGSSDQQDEPLGNPSTEVSGGGDPPTSPTLLLVFPFRPSSGQPASRPTFVVFPVFRQVEPSSIRLLVRLQVRFPSYSHGHAPLSPHRVAIDVPASADVQEEASQEDPPQGNTFHEVPCGISDQQDEPLGNPSTEVRGGGNPPASHTFLLVFLLRPSSGQPPFRPTFVVFPVFRQIEPSSIRLLVRPQVRFHSYSHGHALLSPHRVAIAIPASADVQEEAHQVDKAHRVEEAADPPAPVEEQAQLAVPLRPVIPDFFRFPGIPRQQQLRDHESLVATIQYYKN